MQHLKITKNVRLRQYYILLKQIFRKKPNQIQIAPMSPHYT